MELHIRQTNGLTTIGGVPVRLWEGTDAQGNDGYNVFVHRIAAIDGSAAQRTLERELIEQARPDTPPAGLQPPREPANLTPGRA